MANAIEWGCPSIHLLGVLYLPLPEMFSRSQVRNVWRSLDQLPGDVFALHSAQAVSGQTRQNLLHFPEGERVPKAMQNFLAPKCNFTNTKKRQSPCVLGAGSLGQSAGDFSCQNLIRRKELLTIKCLYNICYNTDKYVKYVQGLPRHMYVEIRL